MRQFVCSICGYIFDEAIGDNKNAIAPGTQWEEVADTWKCPLCGAAKSAFSEKKSVSSKNNETTNVLMETDNNNEPRELSAEELSALFTNLSKGAQKQYREVEAGLFTQLATYFSSKKQQGVQDSLLELDLLMQKDIVELYPFANKVAASKADRGALRALVWSEKVTRMLIAHLNDYKQRKEDAIESSNVYVCEICGFVYIGDEVPDICPVCKVPKMKIPQLLRG